jgi:hypothetical protein
LIAAAKLLPLSDFSKQSRIPVRLAFARLPFVADDLQPEILFQLARQVLELVFVEAELHDIKLAVLVLRHEAIAEMQMHVAGSPVDMQARRARLLRHEPAERLIATVGDFLPVFAAELRALAVRPAQVDMKKRLVGPGAVLRPDLLDAETVAQIADRAKAAHVDQLAAFAQLRLDQIGGKPHAVGMEITLGYHRRTRRRPELP